MRRAPNLELALGPRAEGTSLQRWLYQEISAAILAGRLAPGSRLPTTRDLARQAGVARGTVMAVYDQLAAEGYLSGSVGRGSFVESSLPDQWFRCQKMEAPKAGTAQSGPGLSKRGKLLARSPFAVKGRPRPVRAFRAHLPDTTTFPFDLWTRIANRRYQISGQDLLGDAAAFGYLPLRQAIACHLGMSRGIVCTAEQIMIVSSVQQVIDLSARLLLDPDQDAWMEDPGYPGARLLLEAAGARVVLVPVDAGGLDVAAGQARAPHAKLVYVSAGRQCPLGPPLALERRLALISWAEDARALIIEDDYDSEYRFAGPPLAALKSLDGSGRVIYTGTFSKLLFPALRLAFAVLPEHLTKPFARAGALVCRFSSILPQVALHEFMAEGHFARHLRRMRQLYADRAETLRQAAEADFSGLLELPKITAGLDTPVFLPHGTDDRKIARLAAEAGLECRPLSFYSGGGPIRPGLLLGFGAVPQEAIWAGAATLAGVVRGALENS
jgi:GntR family transcriptional regulator/MocR family aminotransferase